MMRDNELIPTVILLVWFPGILPAAYVVRRMAAGKDDLWFITAMFWPLAAGVLVVGYVGMGLTWLFDALDKVSARTLTGILVALLILGMLIFKAIHITLSTAW